MSTHKYLKNPIFSSFKEYLIKRKQKNIINKKLNKVIEKKINKYNINEKLNKLMQEKIKIYKIDETIFVVNKTRKIIENEIRRRLNEEIIEKVKQRKFIKIDERKDRETKTIEETYINPVLEEDVLNEDYSRFVNDRIGKKEYNGDLYKIRSIFRNIEIDINNNELMNYVTNGIINEIKYLI